MKISIIHLDLGIGKPIVTLFVGSHRFLQYHKILIIYVHAIGLYMLLQFIGGAERLVINMAICLKRMGHDVRILTSHHDVNHCFEETEKNGELETLLLYM